ncbi:unnamed protein product [Blepharisma stoltei]|uniref:Uncharacterized protein n=1 Tax=Blepharisma stoltei TaxID=1481888 RepID=A0AAU9INX5_9CILI|nr:unnamed protein product [Blepharisma stoltei]
MTFCSELKNLTIKWNSTTCLLNDGSIFCLFSSQSFIITPSNSIIHLNSSKFSSYAGLIEVGDFVYLFGGTEHISASFSLKMNNWSTLAPYQIYNNRYISCAFLNGDIIIGGFESQFISKYNILGNKFSTIPVALSNCTGKTCLATPNKAYIIEHNRSYYESGLNNINEWTLIGNADMIAEGYPCRSYVLLHEDCFYFITTDWNLVQFNLKNKELCSSKLLIN